MSGPATLLPSFPPFGCTPLTNLALTPLSIGKLATNIHKFQSGMNADPLFSKYGRSWIPCTSCARTWSVDNPAMRRRLYPTILLIEF